MKRADALREVAALHEKWSLRHGDAVPNLGAESEWQADMYASAAIDNPLNEKIKSILAQIVD